MVGRKGVFFVCSNKNQKLRMTLHVICIAQFLAGGNIDKHKFDGGQQLRPSVLAIIFSYHYLLSIICN